MPGGFHGGGILADVAAGEARAQAEDVRDAVRRGGNHGNNRAVGLIVEEEAEVVRVSLQLSCYDDLQKNKGCRSKS